MRKRRPVSDAGASDLFDYLRNYHRITLRDACDRFVDVDKVSIGIWVMDGGAWRRDTAAERKLQGLNFKGKRSVCASIVTRLYGLSPLEYRKIRTSFEEERWPSWAGIYEANDADQEPEFVLVVELPVKESVVGKAGAAGIGAAVGLAAGLGGLTMWNKLATKNSGRGDLPHRSSLSETPSKPQTQELEQLKSNLQEKERALEEAKKLGPVLIRLKSVVTRPLSLYDKWNTYLLEYPN